MRRNWKPALVMTGALSCASSGDISPACTHSLCTLYCNISYTEPAAKSAPRLPRFRPADCAAQFSTGQQRTQGSTWRPPCSAEQSPSAQWRTGPGRRRPCPQGRTPGRPTWSRAVRRPAAPCGGWPEMSHSASRLPGRQASQSRTTAAIKHHQSTSNSVTL